MGTRHLTFVYLDGEYKVAQYGQWDGYPEGAGTNVLSFAYVLSQIAKTLESVSISDLRAAFGAVPPTTPVESEDKIDVWEFFANQVRKCRVIDRAEMLSICQRFGADKDGNMSLEDSDLMKEVYPSLSRDTGSDILKMIAVHDDNYGEIELRLPLRLDAGFAADSLYCEYAWVIDLDKRTFEGYCGFQKEPLAEGERFAFLQPIDHDFGGTYYPVRQYVSYPLSSLPTISQFLSEWEAVDRVRKPGNYEDDPVEAVTVSVEAGRSGRAGRGARKL